MGLFRSLSFNAFLRSVRAFFVFSAVAALSLYAYLAMLVRLAGDDYCISARLIGFDPLTASLFKYWTVSNRFSNQFVAWLSDGFGPSGVPGLAVFTLALSLIGLTWLLYEIHQALGLPWERGTGVLLAAISILLSLYTAPNLFQATQWRPGLMTYFLPLVLYMFLLAWIFHQGRVAKLRSTLTGWKRVALWGSITVLFLGALFIGGLSETIGALHVTLLGLAWAGTFFVKSPSRHLSRLLIAAALAGAILAMVGMFVTPANVIRLNDSPPPPLSQAIGKAFVYAALFLMDLPKVVPIPLGVAFSTGAVLAYLVDQRQRSALSRQAGWGLVVLSLLAYVLIAASFAPSAYGQSYPVARVRFPAHVVVILTLLAEGYWLGQLAKSFRRPAWTRWLAGLVLLLLALYPLWTIRNNLALAPLYQDYAARWDARHARIVERAAAGQRSVVVERLPALGGIDDLRADPRHWTNFCAAIYYGIDSISTVEESP